MAAQLRIDQDGLTEGTPGKSRTDGLSDGSLVTLTNTGSGTVTEFALLWTPPGDTTAADSLAATGDPKVWTFAPTPGQSGSYLVELVENRGLTSEVRERRVLVVRTPNRGLVIPAFNERGDRNATLVATGSGALADNNAEDYPDAALNARPYASWWRALHELIIAVDSSSEGGGAQPAMSLRYLRSTVTTDADPGEAFVRVSAGGDLLVNPADANGADWTPFFEDLSTGYVRMETLDGATWVVFQITGVETDAGYYRLFVSSLQSNGDPFTDAAPVRLTFDGSTTGRATKPSITGETTALALESVIAALVALKIATDDR